MLCTDADAVDHAPALDAVAAAHGGRTMHGAETAGLTMVAFSTAAAGLAAAVALQAWVAAAAAQPIRIGLVTGDVTWSDGTCSGAVLLTAAQLVLRAQPAQILTEPAMRWLAAGGRGAVFSEAGTIDVEGDVVTVFEVDWRSASADDKRTAVEAPAVPLPAGIAAEARLRLVGRQSEWAVLEDAWRRAAAGGREVVLLSGEAGAGKTRLAGDFVRRCHEAGAIGLLGTCDADLSLPYQPWVHALDHLLRFLPGYGRLSNSERDLGDLLVMLPQLEGLLPGLTRSVAGDAETERYLLFSAVDRVLANTSQLAPTVLFLDDLHWAGRQTLELLRHVVRFGSASRLMVVATFRDAAVDLSEAFAECLADLQRSQSVTRLRVGRLDADGVEQYVAGALGQDLDADLRRLAALVSDRSGGNAFFLGELWRHLLHHGVIVRDKDRWVVRRDLASVGSPDSVRDVVSSRTARLTLSARRLLELAATAGQRVELPVLSLAAELESGDLGAELDELVDAGFLVEVGSRPPAYQFTHALVHDTVEAVLSTTARARLHGRVAHALEAVHRADLRSVYAELAHHFAAAATLGDASKAVQYCRLAADQARVSSAYEEAVAHYQAALDLLPDDSPDATAVRIDLGQVHMRSGHSPRGRDLFGIAFAQARRHRWKDLAALAALGFEECGHQQGALGGPAVRIVSEAIELLGEDHPQLRARLQASLTRSLMLAGDAAAARAAGEVALTMARQIGDVECVLAALQAAILLSGPQRSIEISEELRAVGLQSGDEWSATYATGNICRGLMHLGKLREAAEVLVQHQAMAERGRFVVFQFMGVVYEAVLALAAGRLDEAEHAAERAHALGESSNIAFDAGVYGLQMFTIRREQGRLGEVLPLMRVLSGRQDAPTVWRPGLAVLYAELGMLAEARQLLDELSFDAFAAVPRDSVWPACLTFLAETCIACGAAEYAGFLRDELASLAGQTLMVGMTVCFGPADRLRGGLAQLLGKFGDAERDFVAALELAERSGSPVWRAHVLLDWSRLALARGEHDRAVAMATEANVIAAAVGMNGVIGEANDVIHRSPAPVTASTAVDGLSAREVEVLRLIAAGHSNKEIGERLFISQHTAANHVRSILQKCACANRAEAAAYAVRRNLLAPTPDHGRARVDRGS